MSSSIRARVAALGYRDGVRLRHLLVGRLAAGGGVRCVARGREWRRRQEAAGGVATATCFFAHAAPKITERRRRRSYSCIEDFACLFEPSESSLPEPRGRNTILSRQDFTRAAVPLHWRIRDSVGTERLSISKAPRLRLVRQPENPK